MEEKGSKPLGRDALLQLHHGALHLAREDVRELDGGLASELSGGLRRSPQVPGQQRPPEKRKRQIFNFSWDPDYPYIIFLDSFWRTLDNLCPWQFLKAALKMIGSHQKFKIAISVIGANDRSSDIVVQGTNITKTVHVQWEKN